MKEIVWKTLFDVLYAPGLITIAAFTVKHYVAKGIENRFDNKIEKVKHEYNKELSAMSARLESLTHASQKIFEEKLGAYKEVAMLVYRCRNKVREVFNSLNKSDYINTDDINVEVENLKALHESLKDSLFVYRLIVDRSIFDKIHEYKNKVEDFKTNIVLMEKEKHKKESIKRMEVIFEEINSSYPQIVGILQDSLGMSLDMPESI